MVRVHQGPPFLFAGMAELADALDLGSSVIDVQVQLLLPAPLMIILNSIIELSFFVQKSIINVTTYILTGG